MTITSVYPNVTPYVGNPAVEMVRRENKLREIIEPVAQMERNASEKGVISEDKSRNNSNLANVTYSDEFKNRNTELKQAVEGRSQDQQQNSGEENNQGDQQKQQQQQQADQKQLAELKARDAEVKAHEAAHASVGGQFAGSPSYTFERGPDGQQYAVGGEVPITLSEVPGDPQATIANMQQVKAAALAPAEPSGADRAIAAEASRRISAAQAELLKENSAFASEPAPENAEVTDENAKDAAADAQNARDRFAGRDKRALQGEDLMQLRSDVIQSFYARATVPAGRSLLNMA
jgi:hypothetical protein